MDYIEYRLSWAGATLPRDNPDEVTHVHQAIELSRGELDSEAFLACDEDLDLLKTIPAGDITCSECGCQNEVLVEEYVMEDIG